MQKLGLTAEILHTVPLMHTESALTVTKKTYAILTIHSRIVMTGMVFGKVGTSGCYIERK